MDVWSKFDIEGYKLQKILHQKKKIKSKFLHKTEANLALHQSSEDCVLYLKNSTKYTTVWKKVFFIILCEVLCALVGVCVCCQGDLLLPQQHVSVPGFFFFMPYSAFYLFQRSLDLHALSPGHCRVSKAISIVCPPGEVNTLLVQVSESLCHHLHGVVSQRWCVLDDTENRWRKWWLEFGRNRFSHCIFI